LKDALQSFEIQVKQSLECLENLLNHDDEMLALLLTEQNAADQTGGQVDFSRHEHVELLLGVYARQISNISMEITYLLQRLQSKQEFVALALSGYRNRMVQMNVHLGVAALSMGLSTAVAGFFGMNLLHGFENSATAFTNVVLCSSLGSLFLALISLNHLSGETMRRRAKKRLDEIDTLTSALSDMCALDHTLKSSVERGECISKEQFRVMLKNSRQSNEASADEVDLLFDVFDKIKDGSLTPSDFQPEVPTARENLKDCTHLWESKARTRTGK
jgi:magnesium transporter